MITESRDSARFADRGGGWVIVQFVLMALVMILGPMFKSRYAGWLWPAIGTSLVIMCAYFGIAGVIVLGRNRTPYPRPREGSVLIQHGIYARVRHPLYTSVILGSAGWALLWASGPSLLAALALLPFFHAKAQKEEAWLCQKFPGYSDYARRVPRFIPALRLHPEEKV